MYEAKCPVCQEALVIDRVQTRNAVGGVVTLTVGPAYRMCSNYGAQHYAVPWRGPTPREVWARVLWRLRALPRRWWEALGV